MLLSNKDTLFPNNMFLLGNNINEGEHELCPPSFRCIVKGLLHIHFLAIKEINTLFGWLAFQLSAV